MTSTERAELVRVAGARLFSRRTGEGPALVLIPGGGGDADMYDAVVPLLAERFTVLTYDRRGNSRSPLDSSSTPVTVADSARDTVALLDHHGIGRAHVFGTSGSAIIALELLARHHDRLLGAVVHEPPLVGLLPGSPEQAVIDELMELARSRGPMQGFVAFAAMTMPGPPRVLTWGACRTAAAAALWTVTAAGAAARRLSGREPGGMARLVGNAPFMFSRELPEFIRYEPDLPALRAVSVPWCFATGADSVGRPYHRPTHVLGQRLDVECVEFPGGHVPYQQHPERFSSRLAEILATFCP